MPKVGPKLASLWGSTGVSSSKTKNVPYNNTSTFNTEDPRFMAHDEVFDLSLQGKILGLDYLLKEVGRRLPSSAAVVYCI